MAISLRCPAARANDLEAQLRDYAYGFASPGDAVGPWHVVKLDLDAHVADDHLLLRAIDGERNDPRRRAHGEFLRLEDTHVFGNIAVTGGLGSGNGYQPLRSATVELLDRPTSYPAWLVAGFVATTLTPAAYQRILALGVNFAAARVSGYVRYYRPNTVGLGVADVERTVWAGSRRDRLLCVRSNERRLAVIRTCNLSSSDLRSTGSIASYRRRRRFFANLLEYALSNVSHE